MEKTYWKAYYNVLKGWCYTTEKRPSEFTKTVSDKDFDKMKLYDDIEECIFYCENQKDVISLCDYLDGLEEKRKDKTKEAQEKAKRENKVYYLLAFNFKKKGWEISELPVYSFYGVTAEEDKLNICYRGETLCRMSELDMPVNNKNFSLSRKYLYTDERLAQKAENAALSLTLESIGNNPQDCINTVRENEPKEVSKMNKYKIYRGEGETLCEILNRCDLADVEKEMLDTGYTIVSIFEADGHYWLRLRSKN